MQKAANNQMFLVATVYKGLADNGTTICAQTTAGMQDPAHLIERGIYCALYLVNYREKYMLSSSGTCPQLMFLSNPSSELEIDRVVFVNVTDVFYGISLSLLNIQRNLTFGHRPFSKHRTINWFDAVTKVCDRTLAQ